MIIIADSPCPHKRILQKGEWRDGGGGRGAAQTARRAVSAVFGRSGGSAAGGCAPISAPFAHPPGGAACRAGVKPQTGKKAGQGRGSLSRRGSPAESPGIGPQARRRLRRRRRRQSLRAPAAPGRPAALPLARAIFPHRNAAPPPAQRPPFPQPTPKNRKKAPPPSGRRFAHIFGFSPAWQGRHGCGRWFPHGPAPPPALCRRRG